MRTQTLGDQPGEAEPRDGDGAGLAGRQKAPSGGLRWEPSELSRWRLLRRQQEVPRRQALQAWRSSEGSDASRRLPRLQQAEVDGHFFHGSFDRAALPAEGAGARREVGGGRRLERRA